MYATSNESILASETVPLAGCVRLAPASLGRILNWIMKGIVALVALAPITAAVAADDWMRLDEELWKIRDMAESDSPHASAQALVRWLHKTPTEGIQKSLDLSRSNVETGIFEVIAAISSRGGHADALEAVDELDKRMPKSDWHDDIVAVKAKLHLRLRHVEEARALAHEAADTVCPGSCDAGIKRWLAKGTLPQAIALSSPKQPWLFDERGSPCESSWATDKLDEFASIDLIEASAGVRTAAQTQLATLWPSLVAGCAQTVDKERLLRLLTLGWTKQELADGFASARKALNEGTLKGIDLLGARLALPDQQCDFTVDATCKKSFKPLSNDTAVRIFERLQPMSPAWAPETPNTAGVEVKQSKDQREASDQLEEQYRRDMDKAADIDAIGGLARMRTILADSRYQHLGSMVDSYSFGQGLGRWSREGHAAEALQVFNLALDAGGSEFQSSPGGLTGLALLQLRSGDSKSALASLEKRYALSPDEETAKTIGKLRAAIGGANMLQQYPPPQITRPWHYSSGWPICDFFNITGGLERVENVDLIMAFQGEREAALWQLAHEWPSVVGHCFNGDIWHEVRTRLQRVLGAEGFAQAAANAEKSLELGPAPHFQFAGQELPLPDSEEPFGSRDQSPIQVTRERLLQIIDETHLLKGCGRESSERCN
jgi:hypothetical protein